MYINDAVLRRGYVKTLSHNDIKTSYCDCFFVYIMFSIIIIINVV